MENEKDYPVPEGIDSMNVVSSTECTGLFAGMPDSEANVESYTDICDVPEQGSLNDLESEINDKSSAKRHKL